MADVFDTAGAQTQPTAAQQTAANGATQGDVFDAVAGTQPSTATAPSTQPTAPSDVPTAIQSNPGDSLLMKGAKGVGGLFQGIGEGVFGTAAGASDIIDRTTGMQRGTVNRYLHNLSTDTGHDIISPQGVGQIGESTAEFLLGDEYLKGLALSDRLAQSAKVAKFLEGSPVAAKVFELRVRALRAGGVQGLMTGVKTGGDARQAGEQGLLAGGLTAGLGTAGEAVRAIPALKAFNLKAVADSLADSHADIQKALETSTNAIRDDWHQAVRDIFDKSAQDAGVTPKPATSLHDVASNLSDAVKQKAQQMYRSADAAVSGNGTSTRIQSFREALDNVQQAIRQEAGLDPAREKILQTRLADAKAAYDAAKETLVQRGLPPGLLEQADQLWTKAKALEDTSKPIQASISGLRADLQNGVNAAQEVLSPAKLAARLNKLYNSDRLQQAIGDAQADKLLQTTAETQQRLTDAANAAKQQADAATARAAQRTATVKTNRAVAGAAAAGTALGGIPGYALLKHLLSPQ